MVGAWWTLASLRFMSLVQQRESDTLATGHHGNRFSLLCRYSHGTRCREITSLIFQNVSQHPCGRLCDQECMWYINPVLASQNLKSDPPVRQSYPCFRRIVTHLKVRCINNTDQLNSPPVRQSPAVRSCRRHPDWEIPEAKTWIIPNDG